MKQWKRALLGASILAAFSTASHAGVTIYGAIKPTIQSIKADPGIARRTEMTDSGSFLGIRGSEDLGNGMSVYFVLQKLYDVSGGGGALQQAQASRPIGPRPARHRVPPPNPRPLRFRLVEAASSGGGGGGVMQRWRRRGQMAAHWQ